MVRFEWDSDRERLNIENHGVDFWTAMRAFNDPGRQIHFDAEHSQEETRLFCLGIVEGKILTVRFVYREGNIRIFGAGYWRKGKEIYEKEKW